MPKCDYCTEWKDDSWTCLTCGGCVTCCWCTQTEEEKLNFIQQLNHPTHTEEANGTE